MERSVNFYLNRVKPIPSTLRSDPRLDSSPAASISVNLGALFLHHYFDSYGIAPPNPDPSRFEYLDLISSSSDFRFHSFVASASSVKKRHLSTEFGQSFCRLMLQEHFGIRYFAHMADVLDKPTHAAFDGLRIARISSGDTPDYLCARKSTEPRIAEAKGRFSTIGFSSTTFQKWRDQFDRICLYDRRGKGLSMKGFIIATRLAAEGMRNGTCVYLEDPDTHGEPVPTSESLVSVGRVAIAMHYASVFRKLGLAPLANALHNGFDLTPQLSINIPVWTCMVPPFQGAEFVGGGSISRRKGLFRVSQRKDGSCP